MSYSIKKERQLLLVSTFSALLFAMLGIVLGMLIHSLVIIFDGVYSLVSLGLTLISLVAVLYIRKEDVSKNIKRVKVIESSVILLKGIAITLMCVFSFVAAVQAIMEGGREVNTGIALSFANAISGIIIVGALLQVGQGNGVVSFLAFIAVLIASINIFGGFAVTKRMLEMFRKDK